MPGEAVDALDIPAMREDLARALPRFGVDPLSADEIVSKRDDALSRPPLADATSPHVAVPELAGFLEMLVARTIVVAEGTLLLGDE